ncbi:NADH-quinone oxidoreductase subunit NuoG [Uliginosibacterium sp. H1]|uniref:NADH-quinone oxidoreductase subunit NuoG n=1 Tax=Uliginosibacterium sp. H1 TaxID=3114757 RepID=UPI002E182B38|nr:NADH-quinone oxidoreductase subunit NuoG [Uliginosibacterium sp. H1]
MLEIEIDGTKLEVPDGSTVIDAANRAGTYIPHFCYHKKLSIAANCRMCLVDVEKAPKPLPACATPVTNGMKVSTHSSKAVNAQKGVMEFLLINHPLDCPICDQGGECQLQDLAVGYGAAGSRYKEEKRVVVNKNLGPLISTDMTRCIHCTRCVRFGQEIAGVMELGMANRGEHSEIMSFVGRTVDSELSGNMIDLCPVGALTSKPFRFSARTWELSRRKSVSPHDSLGANLIVQVKHDEVKRVLPLENEAVNECWISDKDRFSYEALRSPDRLIAPRIKQGGVWREVDWQTALEYAASSLKGVAADHGAQQIGALLSPHSTLEELYLAQKLVRGVGSDNVDFRLRQSDFSLDGKRAGAPWLGLPVAELSSQDAVLVVGSFLRKDHPLLAQRLRRAASQGCDVMRLHVSADDLLMTLAQDLVVAPSDLVRSLAAIVKAAAKIAGAEVSASVSDVVAAVSADDQAEAIARALSEGEKAAVLLGNFAVQHPNAASLELLAAELARLTQASVGVIGEAANSVGGYIAGALPQGQGAHAAAMLATPLKGYLLLGVEPDLDCADGLAARKAAQAAESVIYLGSFASDSIAEMADVMLPVSPFAETSGSYVNAEGRVQSFHAVTKPLGDSRPAWKVLRVLANLLQLDGFAFDSSEAVRAAVLAEGEVTARLSNAVEGGVARLDAASAGLQRVADVPIHFADALVRRAPALQATRDGAAPSLRANAAQLAELGLQSGDAVRVRGSGGDAALVARADESVPAGCVRVAAAHAATVALGGLHGTLTVERA